MEAIDKVRDTSTSHERCSIIEVMGRGAGWLALWCGIANGAEDVLIPEKYDYDEQKLINNIIESRKMGKKHHIIINAEGIGHSQAMATRIEAATGIETRATILGHMQRGGSPTCKDRVYASMMGAMAVDLLLEARRAVLLDTAMVISLISISMKLLQWRRASLHICGRFVSPFLITIGNNSDNTVHLSQGIFPTGFYSM